MKSISIAELDTGLMGLEGEACQDTVRRKNNIETETGTVETIEMVDTDGDKLQVGEHVASFWFDDDNVCICYLEVVSEGSIDKSPDTIDDFTVEKHHG